jgi:NTP pyrophosphatase (non-canonical NTP hydrolase)
MTDLNKIQNQIEKFNKERDWGKIWEIKDLLLNMNEEIGEMWHVIKWIDENKQELMINQNKAEVENFIGDMLYLLLKISFISKVDSEKAIKDVLEEYEKRFPKEETKGRHGNVRAGGIDKKNAI